jgi:2-phospho-L-lactate transferase/gluconeogenesis factor (CofD/UPF0052 family)
MVAVLSGGIGGRRPHTRLAQAVRPDHLTIVVNSADDRWCYGLRACPDLDTTPYAPFAEQDDLPDWGVRGDSWRCIERRHTLGEEARFQPGNLDLATCLSSASRPHRESELTAMTATLAQATERRSVCSR